MTESRPERFDEYFDGKRWTILCTKKGDTMTESRPERFDEYFDGERWTKSSAKPSSVEIIEKVLMPDTEHDYYIIKEISTYDWTYLYRTKKEKVCDKCNGSGKL